jgi:hypothetical protein
VRVPSSQPGGRPRAGARSSSRFRPVAEVDRRSSHTTGRSACRSVDFSGGTLGPRKMEGPFGVTLARAACSRCREWTFRRGGTVAQHVPSRRRRLIDCSWSSRLLEVKQVALQSGRGSSWLGRTLGLRGGAGLRPGLRAFGLDGRGAGASMPAVPVDGHSPGGSTSPDSRRGRPQAGVVSQRRSSPLLAGRSSW